MQVFHCDLYMPKRFRDLGAVEVFSLRGRAYQAVFERDGLYVLVDLESGRVLGSSSERFSCEEYDN